MAAEEMRGCRIYVDRAIKDDQLTASLQRRGFEIVDTRMEAHDFVVASHADRGDRNVWRAILVGDFVASTRASLQGSGVALAV